ncbi:UDP-N-acetylmuramoyl-tripeptide--D-alanyl-D-alanine ligase [Actinomyces radicidentis]|uniref:UDP-N-acetylmuramoyl-tripeptide--D-alanyl-D- alanine ligase n=1 Tax=Actinomyces radicidentis TaxID=111015 RepID=UPI0026E080E9|nr:UDP-N-acetylmuramoyl-tripeptide--D-alanyl-D-alanine ligase [Actinomyces radicidentis]
MIERSLTELAAMVGGELLDADGTEDAPVVASVVTDSRKAGPGALFVAIAGERTDGHAHLGGVLAAGGAAALVSDLPAARAALDAAGAAPDDADGERRTLPLILVEDTVEALGLLARAHLADLRERAASRGSELTVVAMTGSVGKTTTKDLTRQLLAAQAPTVAPIASFNNEIGLPLTVLETDESTRYLVLEMGASGFGHISYLTGIAPLDAAAVLMIGHAHMGGFGSVDGVAEAKSEIVQGLLPGGTAVLNYDDERAWAMRAIAPGPVLAFSASGDPAAEIRAENVEADAQAHAVLDLVAPGAPTTRVRLGLPGLHNVGNALAAVGLAIAAGVPAADAVAALAGARIESPHRLDVRTVGAPDDGDILLIDDSYNANIDSMTASLASLPALAGERRRVVVISEMLELGEFSDADHARTGELVADAGASLLVTIGEGAAPAAETARRAGVGEVVELPDADAALTRIDALVRAGDAVLVKGSNGSGAWRVANHLAERPVEGTPGGTDR